MLIVGNSYSSFDAEEGVIAFLCTASIYWLIVSIVVAIKYASTIPTKPNAKRFITKGWWRLHILLSLIGGLLSMSLYSIIVGEWDIDDWGPAILWPLAYWLWILILWGINKFNNGILSKEGLTIHAIINCCISIIVIIYVYNIEETYSSKIYKPYDDGEAMFSGQLSFSLYFLLLFAVIWILNGFKEGEKS